MKSKKWKVTITVNGIKGNMVVIARNINNIFEQFNDNLYVDKNDDYIVHHIEYIGEYERTTNRTIIVR